MSPNPATVRAKPNALRWVLGLVFLVVFAGAGLAIYSKSARFLTAVQKPLVDADAGFKKATNTMDAEKVRTWALENVRKQSALKEMYTTMPKDLRTLYDEPPDIVVDDEGLTLSWGGGFFHWVFYIGDTNDTLPFHSLNAGYPYNFEWRPGIYYTREANMELQ